MLKSEYKLHRDFSLIHYYCGIKEDILEVIANVTFHSLDIYHMTHNQKPADFSLSLSLVRKFEKN